MRADSITVASVGGNRNHFAPSSFPSSPPPLLAVTQNIAGAGVSVAAGSCNSRARQHEPRTRNAAGAHVFRLRLVAVADCLRGLLGSRRRSTVAARRAHHLGDGCGSRSSFL